jgi:hypothetical protein
MCQGEMLLSDINAAVEKTYECRCQAWTQFPGMDAFSRDECHCHA